MRKRSLRTYIEERQTIALIKVSKKGGINCVREIKRIRNRGSMKNSKREVPNRLQGMEKEDFAPKGKMLQEGYSVKAMLETS